MISLIVFHCVLCQIVALVSTSFVVLFMAIWMSCRFFSEVFCGLVCFLSRMPLYTVACVSVGSFAPWMSKSLGISRFRGSGVCLFAPCFASVLLPSLPWTLLCPFTHCRVVLADLYLIRWAAFLNNFAFFMPIYLSFSHDSRWVVSPSITYLESVIILTGW